MLDRKGICIALRVKIKKSLSNIGDVSILLPTHPRKRCWLYWTEQPLTLLFIGGESKRM